MTGVYSSRLWAGTINHLNTRQELVQVPTGERFVVKYVSGFQTAGSGVILAIYVGPSDALTFRAAPDANGTHLWNVTMTFHEGETIRGRAITQDAIIGIHGYVLSGSGGPPVPTASAGVLPAPPRGDAVTPWPQ